MNQQFIIDEALAEEIRELYIPAKRGRGATALARKFNLSEATIHRVLGLFVPAPPRNDAWTIPDDEKLTELWAEGLSCSQIAARMGNRTKNAIIGRSHRLGLPKRKSGGDTTAQKAKKAAVRRKVKLETIVKVPTFVAKIVPARQDCWEPLPNTFPKPLEHHQTGECLWIVGDKLCCCAPVSDPRSSVYCETHYQLSRGKPVQEEVE